MKKQLISQALESHLSELVSMSDQIYDFAEPGMEEIQSSRLLTEYLKAKGFEVECGIAGLPTAFRAVYEQGSGGPSFGFLAEYDAIKDIGHACGHHIQGPSVIGAALALCDVCGTEYLCGCPLYGTGMLLRDFPRRRKPCCHEPAQGKECLRFRTSVFPGH